MARCLCLDRRGVQGFARVCGLGVLRISRYIEPMAHDDANVFEAHDHTACTSTAMAQADARAKSEKLRLTPVRRRALEILLEEHKAMGAYEVLERLAADGFGAQPPVAYRALDFLVEHGFAHRVQRLNAFAACTDSTCEHQPVFLICEECKLVAEIPQSKLRPSIEAAAAEVGFKTHQVNIELVGRCSSCKG